MSIRERNGRFEVVVYLGRDAFGKRHAVSKTARTLREAKILEGQLLAEHADKRPRDGADATFWHLLDRWLTYAGIEESTRYQERLMLTKHVKPLLGDVKLSRLRASDLDALYHHLGKGDRRKKVKPLAPSTVRRVHTSVRSALNQGVKWGWIAKNPAVDATPPAEQHRDPEAPSTELVLRFLALLEDREQLGPFVWLVATTGLRPGAACALRRSDLDEGSVRTRRALGRGKGAPYVKGTKTGIRHALAIGEMTMARLEAMLRAQDKTAAGYGYEIGPDAYLFSHAADCAVPWNPQWPAKQLRAFREHHPDIVVTPRGLRHWMITAGLDGGAGVKAVSGRASHARASMTLDRYAAWVPASDRSLAELLESFLAPERD